jgi:hypothetical protein
MSIDSSLLENQWSYICFFMGRSPERRRSETETELHGFTNSAVWLKMHLFFGLYFLYFQEGAFF